MHHLTTGSRNRLVTGFLITLGFLLSIVAFAGPTPAKAVTPTKDVVGGWTSWPEEMTVKVAPGQTIGPVNWIFVENPGDRDADLEWEKRAPAGIELTPTTQKATLKPGEGRKFPFTIAISPGQAAGLHNVAVFMKQTNAKPEKGGTITFAPSFGGEFNLDVGGTTSEVTVNVVNKQDKTPIPGDLSLNYLGGAKPGKGFIVNQVQGSTLTSAVAPGSYEARFQIPGIASESQTFAVASGEKKIVTLEINAVYFTVVAAKERLEGSELATAELIAGVNNTLGVVEGPAKLEAHVRRDGEDLGKVLVKELPALPVGSTEGSTIYRPTDGWKPGTYTFEYSLTTAKFTLTSPKIPEIVVATPFNWLAAGIIGAVLLLTLLLLIFIVGRRRFDLYLVELGSDDPAVLAEELRVITKLRRDEVARLMHRVPVRIKRSEKKQHVQDAQADLEAVGAVTQMQRHTRKLAHDAVELVEATEVVVDEQGRPEA